MANPLAAIWDDVEPVKPTMPAKAASKSVKAQEDYSEAEAIYTAYLARKDDLAKRAEYARQIVKATGGGTGYGMTPVEPLATMGCGSGPLLCDHCLKPIILEGGKFHGVYADIAWSQVPPEQRRGWKSYIKGGMVVEVVENSTLRIYHGYGKPTDCDFKGRQAQQAREAKHVRDTKAISDMVKYLKAEFGNTDELGAICSIMFSFDPGNGVNFTE